MKKILLISAIIFALAFFMPGCGKSPDNQKAGGDQPAREAGKTVTPAVEERVEQKAETKQAVPQGANETASEAAGPASSAAGGADTVADVIEMKNTAAFSIHTRAIVMFDHKKHIVDEPDGHGLACGECHHDEDGEPLELKEGDPVQGCMDCHQKPDRPKKPKGMPREEWNAMQLEYYYGAIHANCIDCHTAIQAGPTKCNECHPKAEK